MFPQNFNSNIFVQEELARFTQALSAGRVQDLATLVSELTPAKEIEIQKLLNHFSPVFAGYEQKVKGFIDELETKENLKIVEPKQEEEIDRLIRKELDSVKSRNKIKSAINELNSLKSASQEEAAKIQETIKEHNRMLKELEKSLADINVDAVRSILKNTTPLPENAVVKEAEEVKDAKEEEIKEEKKDEPVAPKEVLDLETTLPVEPLLESSTSKEESPVSVNDNIVEVKKEEVLVESEKEDKPQTEKPKLGFKECCGSKGFKHKKLCPLKNK